MEACRIEHVLQRRQRQHSGSEVRFTGFATTLGACVDDVSLLTSEAALCANRKHGNLTQQDRLI